MEDLVSLQRNHVELSKEEDLQLSGEWSQICLVSWDVTHKVPQHTDHECFHKESVFRAQAKLNYRILSP